MDAKTVYVAFLARGSIVALAEATIHDSVGEMQQNNDSIQDNAAVG